MTRTALEAADAAKVAARMEAVRRRAEAIKNDAAVRLEHHRMREAYRASMRRMEIDR